MSVRRLADACRSDPGSIVAATMATLVVHPLKSWPRLTNLLVAFACPGPVAYKLGQSNSPGNVGKSLAGSLLEASRRSYPFPNIINNA